MTLGNKGINLRVTGVAIIVLVASLLTSELIPVQSGAGYDGRTYMRWARELSIEKIWTHRESRPDRLRITSYNGRRLLVPVVLHYTLRALGVDPTVANLLAAFRIANLVFLSIAVLLWCLAADTLRIGNLGKWLGLIGLIVNYVSWKMPFFYPALTDSAAMAFGTGMLLCYLRGHPWTLAGLTLSGGFVWPTIPFFGIAMLAFPREHLESVEPAPHSGNRIAAASCAALAVVCTVGLLLRGYNVHNTTVEPIAGLVPVSIALVAIYLYLALSPLLDSASVWRDIAPRRIVSSGWVMISMAVFLIGEAILRSIDRVPVSHLGAYRTVGDTFMTAIYQPGIFIIAHALHYGPLILLLLFVWKRCSEEIRRQGTGLVLCFALAVLLSVGSESRKLINFYPAVLLFLVHAVEPIFRSTWRMASIAGLSVLVSKIWLPMSESLEVPWIGEITWSTLYHSSRGPWINAYWWAGQSVLMLAIAALLYAWHTRPPLTADPPGHDPGARRA
ncbi:MAG: hypothetical protein GY944_19095 [bacterium]|nr:hypothetical protein [bacterium]